METRYVRNTLRICFKHIRLSFFFSDGCYFGYLLTTMIFYSYYRGVKLLSGRVLSFRNLGLYNSLADKNEITKMEELNCGSFFYECANGLLIFSFKSSN